MGPPSVPRQVLTSASRVVSVSDSSSISGSTTSTVRTHGSSASAIALPEQPHEEWALMQLASRLGTIVQASDVKTQDEELKEAKLLMSLSCSTAAELTQQQQHETSSPSNLAHQHHHQQAQPQHDNHDLNASGRITPQSVASSHSSDAASTNSRNRQRREAFRFTCPSLSLETINHHDHWNTVRDESNGNETSSSPLEERNEAPDSITPTASSAPALLLGRTLKVDDVDALRLSSDAMARNVLMSFQKAMEWRLESWVESLSHVLLKKEQELHEQYYQCPPELREDYQQRVRHETLKLLSSDEALLVAALRECQDKIDVQQASTSFKVLHRVARPSLSSSSSAVVSIDSSSDDNDDMDGMMEEWAASGRLEEGQYLYDVTHLLEMQSTLSISTPAGYVKIDINVPGNIKGLFLSAAVNDDGEELTNVKVSLNTNMLASMIDKGGRIAVRASVEAMLQGDHVESPSSRVPVEADTAAKIVQNLKSPTKTVVSATAGPTTTVTTSTPKLRKKSKDDRPVSSLVVVTPRDASSPSTFADSSSDSEDSTGKMKPVSLQIPDNFKRSGTVLFPQATRYPPMKKSRTDDAFATTTTTTSGTAAAMPNTVTPMKATSLDRLAVHHQAGPNFPELADTAVSATKTGSQ